MSDPQDKPSTEPSKYHVEHAVNSAIGDHANVNNYFSAQAASNDPAIAELRALFEQVNQKLAALPKEDRELLLPAVRQTEEVIVEIQQGNESEEKQSFLAKRLHALHNMAEDIGTVIIATLAHPAAGIALTIQKIARRAMQEAGIDTPTDATSE